MVWEDEQQATLEQLIEGFHPEENEIDQKLLYFITGREPNNCMLDWRRVNDDGLAGTGVFKSKIQFDDEDGDPGDKTSIPEAQQQLLSGR